METARASTTCEFDGKKYARAAIHQKQWGLKLIEGLQLRGDEHILDLGCGDGALTACLADRVRGGRVVGIDASRGMIEAAREHQRPNLSFLLMDINGLDFENTFDIVFSNAALHWIPEHGQLYRRALRAMKPGGLVRFNFGSAGNCAHFIKAVQETMALPVFAQFFNDFQWPWFMPEPDEYRVFVEQFPFSQVQVWAENADRSFPTAEALADWIDQPSIVPFLKHVPESDKQRFRDCVVEKTIAATFQNDGTCFEIFRRIHVAAKK